MRQMLRLLAPYFAVGLFCCLWSNAWLALIAYHTQILFWSRGSLSQIRRPACKRLLLLGLPTVATGPLLYVLLLNNTHTDIQVWLANHRLTGLLLTALIPYFGLINPWLEEIHWTPLRNSTWLAHLLFAGYHVLVLYSLLTIPWLILCFTVLLIVSYMWQQLTRMSQSLIPAILSHILADLGIVVAVWLYVK
jgi:hypothetical protein